MVTPRRAAEHRTVLASVFGSRQAERIERPANLREAQSSRQSGSSHEGAVRWEATPELVSQDRERVEAFGFWTRLRTPAYPSLGAVGAGSNAGPHFFWAKRAVRLSEAQCAPHRLPTPAK